MGGDDPLFKKLAKGWWFKVRGGDPEDRLTALVESLPHDQLMLIQQNRHDEPLVKRIVLDFAKRRHLELDVQLLQTATKRAIAAAKAYESMERVQTARHRAVRAPKKLDQDAEYEDAQHRTRMIEEWVKRIRLRQEAKALRNPPPPEGAARPRPDPLEQVASRVSAALGRLRKDERTRGAKAQIVHHLVEAEIVAAEARGENELAARLRRLRVRSSNFRRVPSTSR